MVVLNKGFEWINKHFCVKGVIYILQWQLRLKAIEKTAQSDTAGKSELRDCNPVLCHSEAAFPLHQAVPQCEPPHLPLLFLILPYLLQPTVPIWVRFFPEIISFQITQKISLFPYPFHCLYTKLTILSFASLSSTSNFCIS